MAIAYAILIGVAPIILSFIAGFLGATIDLGWPAYIAWLIACLVAGAIITIVRGRSSR